MLAVIRRLENWRHLLEDTEFKFEVWMNYKNLEYFIKVQKLNQRQARQALYLSKFNFTLQYVPGARMEKVNRLSKKPDQKVEIENDDKNQKLIKEEWVQGMTKVVEEGSEAELVEKIKRAREKDEEVVKVVEEIKKVEVRNLRDDEQKIKRDLVLKKEKVYTPKDEELRVEII